MGKFNNTPPDQRANWGRLNEGQRRYAWEQYKLALVRRGLPIDHPVPEGGQGNADDLDAILDRPAEGESDLADQLGRELGGQQAEEVAGPSIEDFDESYFESGHQGTNNQPHSNMADSTVGQSGAPVAKRRKQAGPSTSADGAKKLPGTAMDQGGSVMEGGPRQTELPHPRSLVHSQIRFYRKVHKVLTYGLAYNNINVINVLPPFTTNYISTPLCYIPWDWLFWYINDSEFALLPNGSSVNQAKIEVHQRNVRVAFPTNASDTNLATLNQNKNIITAIGLNKKVDAVPVRYSAFELTQPMIPNALQPWAIAHYQNLKDEMYGTTTNIDTVVPRHQMGMPMQLPTYLALRYERPEAAGNPQDGWECLQSHYNERDADSTSGNCILTKEYHPSVGLIKAPHKQVIRKLRAATYQIPRGSHILDPQTTSVVLNANGTITSETEAVTATNQTYTIFNNTMQLLEKSQILYEGLFQRNLPQVQDSIHIGVQPTVALTTANLVNDQTNNSFTDTQAYFEIIAECEINTAYPTFRPLTLVSNVKDGNFWEQAATQPPYENPLIDGLRINI
uniref:Structural protein n=1 Tax=Phoenicurus auroreus ambidensovirus TaxID=2794456 RepID=A0A8A4XBV3_9VIRU|nr:MAG: structural protein [Phoenicurus auroreus ambidensovirus]